MTETGRLELVERLVPVPETGEVLIAVEACGICGADRGDIEKADPAQRRVPGHEVVGRIVARGAQVPPVWKVGQRVGVGRFGGHCGECRECRRGRFHLCGQHPVMGSNRDGGYAEMMTARVTGLIPEELSSEEAAPILCAGIATFNGLRTSGAEPGDTVAVLGIGGLGHMALQYARRMGFRVIAVGCGQDIAADALDLGAHRYVDTEREDAAQVLNALGCGLIMSEPESDGSEGDGGEEVAGEFVVAGGDTSEVFELVEEAFDKVAVAVEAGIDRAANPDVALRWDVGAGAVGLDQGDEALRMVAAVGDDGGGESDAGDEIGQGCLVGGLAWGQQQPARQAMLVDDGVDFGGQSAAGATDGVIRAPFFPPAAC
ncbi:MAG: alcohol dehydrogenase catalytic domain-containing protein [Rhodospirillales bacterium]